MILCKLDDQLVYLNLVLRFQHPGKVTEKSYLKGTMSLCDTVGNEKIWYNLLYCCDLRWVKFKIVFYSCIKEYLNIYIYI